MSSSAKKRGLIYLDGRFIEGKTIEVYSSISASCNKLWKWWNFVFEGKWQSEVVITGPVAYPSAAEVRSGRKERL